MWPIVVELAWNSSPLLNSRLLFPFLFPRVSANFKLEFTRRPTCTRRWLFCDLKQKFFCRAFISFHASLYTSLSFLATLFTSSLLRSLSIVAEKSAPEFLRLSIDEVPKVQWKTPARKIPFQLSSDGAYQRNTWQSWIRKNVEKTSSEIDSTQVPVIHRIVPRTERPVGTNSTDRPIEARRVRLPFSPSLSPPRLLWNTIPTGFLPDSFPLSAQASDVNSAFHIGPNTIVDDSTCHPVINRWLLPRVYYQRDRAKTF